MSQAMVLKKNRYMYLILKQISNHYKNKTQNHEKNFFFFKPKVNLFVKAALLKDLHRLMLIFKVKK